MSHKTTLELALAQVYPLIRKTSFELFRANQTYMRNMLPEDYAQDIQEELCRFYTKNLSINDPVKAERLDDVIPIFISRVGLERRHFLSDSVTSKYSSAPRSVGYISDSLMPDEENQDWISPSERFDNLVNAQAEKDGIENSFEYELPNTGFDNRLLDEIKKWEETAPGVTRFVRESMNPSKSTIEKFLQYRENLKINGRIQRRMQGGDIPPTVLLEIIGDNRNRISSFKRVISFALNDLGVSKDKIVSLWNLADLYFTNRDKQTA